MVRLAGLEPARALAHHPLKMACLPFHHNRMEYKWCLRTESNCRHTDFQSVALPTELSGLGKAYLISKPKELVAGAGFEPTTSGL